MSSKKHMDHAEEIIGQIVGLFEAGVPTRIAARAQKLLAGEFQNVEREAWLACDGHAYLRDQIRELRQALRSAPPPAPLTLKWGLAYADWWADIRGRVVQGGE